MVRVNEKVLCNAASPLSAGVRGNDTTPCQGPIDNFSLKGAYLKSEKESYALYMLFPRLSRSLIRRASEVHGAVAPAGPPGGPVVADEVPDSGITVAVGGMPSSNRPC